MLRGLQALQGAALIQLDADLPRELAPLAWLVGTWAGVGVVGYPTTDQVRFGQELTLRHDGRPFLHHSSRTWLLDADGQRVRPLASEEGWWRVPAPLSVDEGPRPVDVELLLAHHTGFVEVYVGRTAGPPRASVELATDVVARTASAKEYTAGRRLYGSVDGDLLWALDMAAVGQRLQSHASARLQRAS